MGFLVRGACKNDPGDEVIASYEAPYPNPESKAGARAFPLILPTSPDMPRAKWTSRNTGTEPFALPQSWLRAKDKLDLTTPFNFVTTNDIIGGNSGSPLINAKGEVIGAIFDGNIHSMGGDYGYDAALNRSVAVSAAAVSEALRKVYQANALARELDES